MGLAIHIKLKFTSPASTLIICAIKLAPTEPETQLSPILSFSVLGLGLEGRTTGLNLPRLETTEKSITGGGAEEERGLGERGFETEPSGAYFLGLPLFFFKEAASEGEGVKEIGGGEMVTARDSEGGLSLVGRGATW